MYFLSIFVFEKAEKEEEREKAVFARFACWTCGSMIAAQKIGPLFPRLERNRRWRAHREDSASGKKEDDEEGDEDEDEEKDEKEKRKRKNKEWRERRSASNSQASCVKPILKKSSLCLNDSFFSQNPQQSSILNNFKKSSILNNFTNSIQVDLTNASAPVPPLSSLLLTELTCPFCQVFNILIVLVVQLWNYDCAHGSKLDFLLTTLAASDFVKPKQNYQQMHETVTLSTQSGGHGASWRDLAM